MPYGLKKLLEIKAEREKRREEKARIKAEKEKKKIEERKKERAKKLLKIRNARAYAKRKKASEEYHKSIGDEKATFSIYLMKNGQRMKYFGCKRFKVAALQRYYEILQENNEKIVYPKTYTKCGNRIRENKYELILVKKINDDDTVSLFRNKDGKFIENYIIDEPEHKIVDKNEWLIEETFSVYGFDPQKERKTFSYIYNNIILKDPSIYSRVLVYKNKLIHHYDDDFDIVTCKDSKQAIKLYDTIEQMIDKKKYPNIFFMGILKHNTAKWILDELVKKTGWSRYKCCH